MKNDSFPTGYNFTGMKSGLVITIRERVDVNRYE